MVFCDDCDEKAGMLMLYFIIILLIILLVFLVRSYYECRHFIISEFVIESEKIPSDFDGFTFVAMTDLHSNEFGKQNEDLIRAIDNINPDAVLIGGDMLVSKGVKSHDVPIKLMNDIGKKYKVYYCYGNHEARLFWDREAYGSLGDDYYDALNNAGICVLNDKHISFHCNDGIVTITGFNIDKKYYHKLSDVMIEEEVIEDKLGSADKNSFNILMAHSPVSFENYAKWGADLVLSGHFHGGTIVAPFLGGLMSPDMVLFPKYYRGRFDEFKSTMIVSGGLGTHSINIRINNRPELIVMKLKRKAS